MKNLKYKGFFAIIGVILILLGGIIILNDSKNLDVSKDMQKPDDTIQNLGDISYFGNAVNDFAFKIFRKIYEEDKPNVFISPYSIFTALAMTYEGAKDVTAEQMADVLGITQDNESFHEYVQGLYNFLNYNKEYNISTANALWIQENYPILEEYKDLILTYYRGDSTDLDFSNPELAAEIINSWIEDKTNNLIQELISPADIDPLYTALVLTNAIYFKGTWQIQFAEKNTTERPFEISEQEHIDAKTMSLVNTQDQFNYTENEVMQILQLKYTGDEICMNIFLPKEGYDLSDIIRTLNHKSYDELISSMSKTELDIYLPKFTIKTPLYTLNDHLKALGMPKAFEPYADFSGMTGFIDLYISKVLHKAYVQINEEGTEAAAATAVIMVRNSVNGDDADPRIVFDADHPFFFTIHHKKTGTILFMGSVDDPSD